MMVWKQLQTQCWTHYYIHAQRKIIVLIIPLKARMLLDEKPIQFVRSKHTLVALLSRVCSCKVLTAWPCSAGWSHFLLTTLLHSEHSATSLPLSPDRYPPQLLLTNVNSLINVTRSQGSALNSCFLNANAKAHFPRRSSSLLFFFSNWQWFDKT